VLDVENWAEIRRLHRAEGLPIREIARVMGVSRNTVRAAVASDGPPRYERRRTGSVVDVVEPRIRELLRAYPAMPATVIAERIGWDRSIRVLSGRVAELRPAYLPPDPASRTAYAAGEIAQCDFWFPPVTLPVGFGQARTAKQLPVLTMVTGYSRWLAGVLIPSREAADLFAGWWRLIEALGAVPRVLVWDGEGAIGRWRAGRPELTRDCQAFRGTLGAKVIICRPDNRRETPLLRATTVNATPVLCTMKPVAVMPTSALRQTNGRASNGAGSSLPSSLVCAHQCHASELAHAHLRERHQCGNG
jgi:transposase